MTFLQQPVSSLIGIGTHSVSRLKKLNIHSIQDLLFHLPHRYEDRTRVYPINSLTAGMTVLVCGRIEFAEIIPKGRKMLVCRICDDTGCLSLKFFHYTANQFNALKTGAWLSCFAEVRDGFAELEMVHPDYSLVSNPNAAQTDNHLTPVYPLTEGLSQQIIRKAIKQALHRSQDELIDWLPMLSQDGYPSLWDALQTLHAPDESVSMTALEDGSVPALKRLAFEELLAHHLSLRYAKHKAKVWQAPLFSDSPRCKQLTRQFLHALPFTLTRAQQRVIADIEADCSTAQPMLRLVQGDVGSGKTVVAAYAALLAIAAGYQVALMSPTELLAEQHYRTLQTWFAGLANVVFLSGQTKSKARADVLKNLADGTAHIAIGTHALFQDGVDFAQLGLIIIDEQHRFGVHQRLALREKGQQHGLRPHQLIMTATPIPRTLAMLQYSDLDISIIDELPPNRTPVVTSVIPNDRRSAVIERIAHWVASGRQVYWVCTLIEESDTLQREAAEKTAELLREALPSVRVGLVHGRLKSSEKDSVMQAFKQHELDLLVATTVIEVGVDVPNAGLMVIENPERLGLSQLHQLRGRVGRGEGSSYCLLLYQVPLSETARQRLGILRDSSDGFVIAEKDLQLRGAGELLGTRQTGQLHFKIADLARDATLLDNIERIGNDLCLHSPHAIQPLCERWLSGSASDYAEV